MPPKKVLLSVVVLNRLNMFIYFGTTEVEAAKQNTEFNMTADCGTIFPICASFSCHVEYVESC